VLKRSSGADASRLDTHVYPTLGHIPLAEISLDHALEVMRKTPEGRSHPGAAG
jgi:hypothetical protein